MSRREHGLQLPLPRLLLIADGFASGRARQSAEAVRARVLEAVRAGVRLVQLRDHIASEDAFATAAGPLAEALRQQGADVRVVVNTRVEVARALGAGLHVGRHGPGMAEARELLPEALLSAAVHTVEEAAEAVSQGADAVLFSPVFPTTSKPGLPGAGLDALEACCATVPDTPVFALGGITPERVGACRTAGAYGVAVLSGLLDPAVDPHAAVSTFFDALV